MTRVQVLIIIHLWAIAHLKIWWIISLTSGMVYGQARHLQLSMDGLNVNKDSPFQILDVNKSFQKYFLKVQMISFWIQELLPCILSVHNSFQKCVPVVYFDFDEFAVYRHHIFKLTNDRKEDYKSMQNTTEVNANYAIKLSSTSCLTLNYVVIRLFEQ